MTDPTPLDLAATIDRITVSCREFERELGRFKASALDLSRCRNLPADTIPGLLEKLREVELAMVQFPQAFEQLGQSVRETTAHYGLDQGGDHG